jgi:hypothetical protein
MATARGFVRDRPIYRRTVIRAVAGLGEPIELSGGVRSAVTHRPDQAASHQGRAVGGASASRNRRFESVPLHRRVSEPSVPERRSCTAGHLRSRSRGIIQHAARRTGGDGKTNPSRALTVQRLQSPAMAPGGVSSAEGRRAQCCINRVKQLGTDQRD